jgi:hypothetical protein
VSGIPSHPRTSQPHLLVLSATMSSSSSTDHEQHTADEKSHPHAQPPRPFSHRFNDDHPQFSQNRSLFFKIVIGNVVLITLTVWIILPIYWGALWKINTGVHNLNGWIVVRFSHELAMYTMVCTCMILTLVIYASRTLMAAPLVKQSPKPSSTQPARRHISTGKWSLPAHSPTALRTLQSSS